MRKGTIVSASLWAIFACAAATVAQSRGYGDPAAEYPDLPNWRERAILVLVNACRMDPAGYRDKYVGNYNILLPSNYPVVGPLYWDVNLNRAARFHAVDMATDCGLTHNSCDGTSFSSRVRSFYREGSGIGENIAVSKTDPFATMNQWIMDGNPPAADKTTQAGHRTNIMNRNHKELGAGYAYGPVRGNHFWVQDFGNGPTTFSYHPIVAGSHFFIGQSAVTFMAAFYASAAPRKATVVISGTSHDMSLHLGKTAAGTYAVSVPKVSGCRNYYFVFTDAEGGTMRYPEGGMLSTYGEGSCTVDYLTSGGKTFASGAVPSVGQQWSAVWSARGLLIRAPLHGTIRSARLFDAGGRLIAGKLADQGQSELLLPVVAVRAGAYFLAVNLTGTMDETTYIQIPIVPDR